MFIVATNQEQIVDPIFEPLPADLAALSDDELTALIETRVALATRLHERDAELIGERSAQNVIDEMTSGVEQIELLRAEVTGREAERTEADAELNALAVRLGLEGSEGDNGDAGDGPGEGDEGDGEGADGDGDGEPDGEPAAEGDAEAEAAAVAEAEAVTAAAAARGNQGARRRNVSLGRSRQAAPVEHVDDGERLTTLTAAIDLPGIPAGANFDDIGGVAAAIHDRRKLLKGSTLAGREKVPVARITRRYPDDGEVLVAGAEEQNLNKIDRRVKARTAPSEALTASGGLCAPATPYYDLQQIATAARPVRDALVRFNAERGAITFASPPTLADVTTGVGIKTAEEDGLGGTNAEKTCQHIECPDLNTVDVDMIYWCLQFGNLQGRTWPEQVRQFTELTMAAHAREAEVVLLDGMKAASKLVTATGELGAVASLLSEILTAAAGYRSRHRMSPDAVLEVALPAWVKDLLVTDMWRSQFQRFEFTREGVVALLRSQRIEPWFYIDSASNDQQVFGAQNPGVMVNFPSTVAWFLYAPGSFLWLDSGVLDLGIVRDSVLNSTNDYSIFGETFEEVAFIGIESLHVVTTVCNSGTTAAPVTVTCPVL